MRPVAEASLSKVLAVFTDVDGTLTTGGKLKATTIEAIERLVEAGVRIVLVSGRPSGWGEAWMRQLPVEGVIVENGGLYFVRDDDSDHIRKVYVQPNAKRIENRKKLMSIVAQALKKFPAARLSMDTSATEVDVAIDHSEDADLAPADVDALEQFLRDRGVTAVRSSVHINCWLGRFNKRTTTEHFLKHVWSERLERDEKRYVYVGDSFNDEPLFQAFPLSIGVANVRDVAAQMKHLPAFVTKAREGEGFQELANAILNSRAPSRASRGV